MHKELLLKKQQRWRYRHSSGSFNTPMKAGWNPEESTVKLQLGPGISRGGGTTPGGQHRSFLLAETCPGSRGLPHKSQSLLSCNRLHQRGVGGCWVFTALLRTLADGYRRELVSSSLYSSRNEAFWNAVLLILTVKSLIHPHSHWTLQTPKGKEFRLGDISNKGPVIFFS